MITLFAQVLFYLMKKKIWTRNPRLFEVKLRYYKRYNFHAENAIHKYENHSSLSILITNDLLKSGKEISDPSYMAFFHLFCHGS
jgi:hypothetical protein